jgi:hypothetical protein
MEAGKGQRDGIINILITIMLKLYPNFCSSLTHIVGFKNSRID